MNFDFAHYAAIYKNQLKDFQAVNEKHEIALTSAVKELEMMLPEAELKGAYEAGDEFSFYKDLNGILSSASKAFVDSCPDRK